jgi:predicted cobalt transporter CbtA
MKNRIAGGTIAAVSGALTAFGPQSLFKICDQSHHMAADNVHSSCYYTAQACVAIGVLSILIGVVYVFAANRGTRTGLSLAVAGNAALVFTISNFLIGVDEMEMMACRIATLPALNVISVLTFALAIGNSALLIYKSRTPKSALA